MSINISNDYNSSGPGYDHQQPSSLISESSGSDLDTSDTPPLKPLVDSKTPLLPQLSTSEASASWDEEIAHHSGITTPPATDGRFGIGAFLLDVSDIHNGTVPISFLIATVIGILCGLAAYLYYTVLEFLLEFLWHTLPEYLTAVLAWSPSFHWMWIPIIGMSCAFLVGLSINILGFPGDLPYTIECVHKLGFVPIGHAPSMVVSSQLSILGGGSLGPEAPLVAICASIAGFVSMTIFGQRVKNVVRKHTLCGMACALAAFFGVPLGGSLFALEVNNRLGVEYFEHALISIASGTVCLVVFRTLTGLPIAPIYSFVEDPLTGSSGTIVMIGALLGLVGAAFAAGFAHFHWFVVRILQNIGWKDRPIYLSLFGGAGICALALLFPQTMFWGEFEMQTIGSLSPASTLTHIWPTNGLTGFEITGFFSAFVLGVAKLVAVSFTVAGGYRGGFIFPFFAAGTALGRAFWFLFPSLSPVVCTLSIAAGINVAITRTAVSTPLILCALAGEGNAIAPVLAASLVSVFATSYMPFILTQSNRENLDEAAIKTYSFLGLPNKGEDLSDFETRIPVERVECDQH